MDLRSGVPQKIFHDVPDDRDTALDSIDTRNNMDSRLKNRKSASKYRYKDMNAYLKNLYQ